MIWRLSFLSLTKGYSDSFVKFLVSNNKSWKLLWNSTGMGFYYCDEAKQFNTIPHLQKILLFDIAHFETIYWHVSIRHNCKNKIVCEKAEYLLSLPPLRSILLSAKFLFKYCIFSFVRKLYTNNCIFYQDQSLKYL